MKVLLVDEDNHGMIAICKDYNSAIEFLLEDGWINADDEICVWYNPHTGLYEYNTIEGILGKNWEDRLRLMTVEEINGFFLDSISLQWEEVRG